MQIMGENKTLTNFRYGHDISGKIVIARYGGNFRDTAKFAEAAEQQVLSYIQTP